MQDPEVLTDVFGCFDIDSRKEATAAMPKAVGLEPLVHVHSCAHL
jgi:hypothetical protein